MSTLGEADLGRKLGIITRDALRAQRKEQERLAAEQEALIEAESSKLLSIYCKEAEVAATQGLNSITKVTPSDAHGLTVTIGALKRVADRLRQYGCHVEMQTEAAGMRIRICWDVAEPEFGHARDVVASK